MNGQSKPLSDFLDQAINALHDAYEPEIFEEGQCANLAIALVRLAQAKGAQGEPLVTVMFRDTFYDGDADPLTTTFSHAFALIEGECIDIHGAEADVRWESRWEEESEDEENRFRYVNCTLDELISLCTQYGVDFDAHTQAEYLEVMRSGFERLHRPTAMAGRPAL